MQQDLEQEKYKMSQKIRVKSIIKTFPQDGEHSMSFPLSNTEKKKR